MRATIHGGRDRAGHAAGRAAVVLVLIAAFGTRVHADWTVAAYLGSSFTHPATLTLTRGGASSAMSTVHFAAKPFQSPPYYGYRVGWHPGGPVGLEAELIHLKVFARAADLAPSIQRFSISHGLNLLLGNLTWRSTERRRAHFEARAGAGVAIPHGESEIDHITQEQYEVSSLALQGTGAVSVRLTSHLSGFGEYKLTTAAPSVSVSGGHITGRYTSQHLAFGLSWMFSRTWRDVMLQRRRD